MAGLLEKATRNHSKNPRADNDDEHSLPDEAFTEDELATGTQHATRSHSINPRDDNDDEHSLPDEAFTEDELATGTQHATRSHIGAEDDKFTMGDVDHPHDAKNQRQSDGEHGVDTALHESAQHYRAQIVKPLKVVKNVVGHHSNGEWQGENRNQESAQHV